MSVTQSRILYVFIMLISTFWASCSQIFVYNDTAKIKENKYVKRRYYIAFIIPFIFLCFTNIGSDYKSYYYIIEKVTWKNYASYYSEEPVMNLVFLLLKTISKGNIDITLFVVKALTIGLFYIIIWKCRKHISLPLAVLAYLLLLYLPSFYLLSIFFAASFVMMAVALYTFNGKWKIGLCLIILAGCFHNAAFLFLPAYLVCLIMNYYTITETKKVALIFGYIIAIFLAGKIYALAQNSVTGFHYNQYSDLKTNGSGLFMIVKYAPLFYIVHQTNELELSKRIKGNLFVFVLTSFLFNALSYKFRVIERMEFYLCSIYVLFFPYVFSSERIVKLPENKRTAAEKLKIIYIAYLLFRGYLTIIERTSSSSGVGNYVFYSPFNK